MALFIADHLRGAYWDPAYRHYAYYRALRVLSGHGKHERVIQIVETRADPQDRISLLLELIDHARNQNREEEIIRLSKALRTQMVREAS